MESLSFMYRPEVPVDESKTVIDQLPASKSTSNVKVETTAEPKKKEITASVPNFFKYNDRLVMKEHIRRDVVDDMNNLLEGIRNKNTEV